MLESLFSFEERIRLVAQILHFAQADVVVAPLHQGDVELNPQMTPEKGNVFVHELFLKIDRVGGHNDPAFKTLGGDHTRHVGLLRRPCFEQRMPAHRTDDARHLNLLRPVFIRRQAEAMACSIEQPL